MGSNFDNKGSQSRERLVIESNPVRTPCMYLYYSEAPQSTYIIQYIGVFNLNMKMWISPNHHVLLVMLLITGVVICSGNSGIIDTQKLS